MLMRDAQDKMENTIQCPPHVAKRMESFVTPDGPPVKALTELSE